MSVIGKRIAACFLKGESHIYVFYDDVTFDILRFEIKGNIKSKLYLTIEEVDLKEKISTTGELNQGKDIQIVETVKQWKMVEEDKKIKTPIHLKFRAEWRL